MHFYDNSFCVTEYCVLCILVQFVLQTLTFAPILIICANYLMTGGILCEEFATWDPPKWDPPRRTKTVPRPQKFPSEALWVRAWRVCSGTKATWLPLDVWITIRSVKQFRAPSGGWVSFHLTSDIKHVWINYAGPCIISCYFFITSSKILRILRKTRFWSHFGRGFESHRRHNVLYHQHILIYCMCHTCFIILLEMSNTYMMLDYSKPSPVHSYTKGTKVCGIWERAILNTDEAIILSKWLLVLSFN